VHTITVFREIKGVKRMQHKKKVYPTVIMAFLTLSMVLAVIPLASAAGAITVTPTTQAPGASVTVDGTGFGATKAVGIGFGAEVRVGETNIPYSGTGPGPYSGNLSYRPIKPGSFVLTSDTTAGGGVVTEYTDNGDGTLSSTSPYFVEGTINYVTGQFSRTSSVDLTDIVQIYSANYTRYTYNVTPSAGATTGPSGTFTAAITVPSVANGNYNVTAIDTQGNRATATLAVDDTVPEGLTIGVMVLLSSVAVIVSSRYFRKQPKIRS
jgi:hypothetical protein